MSAISSYLSLCVQLSYVEIHDKTKTDSSTLSHYEQHEHSWWPLKPTQILYPLSRQTQPAPCIALYSVWHCCHLSLLSCTVSTLITGASNLILGGNSSVFLQNYSFDHLLHPTVFKIQPISETDRHAVQTEGQTYNWDRFYRVDASVYLPL